MDAEDFSWYQCKLCNGKFKTTAELQKHKRCFHRSATSTRSSSASNMEKSNPVATPTTSGHGNETQCSGAKSQSIDSADNKGEMLPKGERYLTCVSCSQKFDAKDPVVLHLLRQSRSEKGALKCPFCSEVLLECEQLSSSLLSMPTTVGTVVKNTKDVKKNCSIDNFAKCHMTSSVEVVPDIAQLSLPKKRKSSAQSQQSTPNIQNDNHSTIIKNHNKNSSESYSVTSTLSISPPVTSSNSSQKSQTSEITACIINKPWVKLQSNQLKHNIEVVHRRSKYHIGRMGNYHYNKSSRSDCSKGASINSRNAPLKVSVLINNNPYPCEERLAVPKGKQFKKGEIHCPYCGFEAKSVREIQFHVNTHLAKSYPCEFCSHVYRSKQGLVKHIAKLHPYETSKLKVSSTTINNSGRKVVEDDLDQRSMFNYSLSFESDNTESESILSEISQSLDSNMENNDSFQTTTTVTSFGAPDIHYNPTLKYFFSTVSSLQDQQMHPELLLPENGTVEKVIDVANF